METPELNGTVKVCNNIIFVPKSPVFFSGKTLTGTPGNCNITTAALLEVPHDRGGVVIGNEGGRHPRRCDLQNW